MLIPLFGTESILLECFTVENLKVFLPSRRTPSAKNWKNELLEVPIGYPGKQIFSKDDLKIDNWVIKHWGIKEELLLGNGFPLSPYPVNNLTELQK